MPVSGFPPISAFDSDWVLTLLAGREVMQAAEPCRLRVAALLRPSFANTASLLFARHDRPAIHG
jgi:hypothetical protein